MKKEKRSDCRDGYADTMRILVTRTDRMGDVILSIPAVRHLRKVCPDAYIAFMVASENRELVMNESDIDEVIAYDKKISHKGFFANLEFVWQIKKKKFDIAIALHPATRTHLILFAAGIPVRIGYDRKWGRLLTKRLPHEKQLGEKHEVDYNLEVISKAGFNISDACRVPRVIPDGKAVEYVESLLSQLGITGNIVAIHPGASCSSKMWPLERFAEAGDALAERYSAEIVVVGDGSCAGKAERLSCLMKKKPADLTGKLSLSQLAALFSKCIFAVSNDSGPAHAAAAAGIPVIVIFGRNDPGLSPARWAPVTDLKRVLHCPPECPDCSAHNCKIGFLCLRNVTVGNVVHAAEDLMARRDR
jgi:heptosyltransferase II